MERPTADIASRQTSEGFDPLLEGMIARPAIVSGERAARERRCTASGYLGDGCRCELQIPEHVVIEAWERERAFGNFQDRLFRIFWRDQVWLAYGIADGSVRGVRCPQHRAAREERSLHPVIATEATSTELASV